MAQKGESNNFLGVTLQSSAGLRLKSRKIRIFQGIESPSPRDYNRGIKKTLKASRPH